MLYTRKSSDFIYDVSITPFQLGDEDCTELFDNGTSVHYIYTLDGKKVIGPGLFLICDEMGNKDVIEEKDIHLYFEKKAG